MSGAPLLRLDQLPHPALQRLLSFVGLSEMVALQRCSRALRQLVERADVHPAVCLSADHAALTKLAALATRSPPLQLRSIALPFCSDAVGDGEQLAALLGGAWPSLVSVNLDACYNLTSEAVQRLARALKHLAHLSLYWCPLTDDDAVRAISAAAGHRLVSLNLSGAHRLTDDAVRSIATHCCNLQRLDLTKAVKLSDASLHALGASCAALRSLKVYACPNFSDEGVAALAEGCVALELLDVCGAARLTDDGVAHVAQRCVRLRSLNLTWCTRLTDASLASVGQHCHDLRSLSVFGVKAITDAGLRALAAGCHHVHFLDLNGCPQLQHWSLETLHVLFPRLRTLAPL